MTTSDADFLLFETGHGPHLLLADGSRVYGIDEQLEQELRGLLDGARVTWLDRE